MQYNRQMVLVFNNSSVMNRNNRVNYCIVIRTYTDSEQDKTAYATLFQHLASGNYALVVASAY